MNRRAPRWWGALSRNERRLGAWTLLLGVTLLLALTGVRPPSAPPLYDGLGFPDEVYRWVVPPAGAPATPAAGRAAFDVPVTAGRSAAGQGASPEQGPQVALAVGSGALDVHALGAEAAVRVAAEPVSPPAGRPTYGQLVSNVYRIRATSASGAPVPIGAGGHVVVNLRADKATRDPVVISEWDGATWQQLRSYQVGTEIYAAELPGWGELAAVRLAPGVSPQLPATAAAAPGSAGPGASGPAQAGPWWRSPVAGVVGGGLVLVVAAGLVILRRLAGSGSDAAHA